MDPGVPHNLVDLRTLVSLVDSSVPGGPVVCLVDLKTVEDPGISDGYWCPWWIQVSLEDPNVLADPRVSGGPLYHWRTPLFLVECGLPSGSMCHWWILLSLVYPDVQEKHRCFWWILMSLTTWWPWRILLSLEDPSVLEDPHVT